MEIQVVDLMKNKGILSDCTSSIGGSKLGKLINILNRLVVYPGDVSEYQQTCGTQITNALSGGSLVSSLCSSKNFTSEMSRQPALLNSRFCEIRIQVGTDTLYLLLASEQPHLLLLFVLVDEDVWRPLREFNTWLGKQRESKF
jgi:hypothetical protein